MHRILIAVAVVSLTAATAAAQTKISGTLQCGKSDPQHIIPVGDHPDHNLAVGQSKCTYAKSMEIEGAKSTEGVSTATDDLNGNTIRSRGFHVATMDSGDKYFVWYQGAGELKGGALQSEKGTWGFTGGSGKLKGIKGKGTYTCTPSGDGLTCEVEGEYQLAK